MSSMISYAQNGEDVILRRVFGDTSSGCYVDIGASHPEKLSVTKYFYDSGWQGINIEPLKENIEVFQKERIKDINLNVAIGDKNGCINFYKVTNYSELSTFSEKDAGVLSDSGYAVECIQVDVITGNELFDNYVNKPVDFLKIDVEGGERVVISSIDFLKHRPKVLVIEATIPNAPFPGWKDFQSIFSHNEWEPLLLKSGYIFAYFDGLNRFYVREENKELLLFFKVGLCLWDDYVISSQVKRIAELEWHCSERMKQIETLTEMVNEKSKEIL